MPLTRDVVTAVLTEFAQWLEFEGLEPIELLVCGGVAMALQELNDRTTKDVDVLGEWDSTLLEVTSLDEFPENVKSCIRRVAGNHPELSGFGEKWINLGPTQLARQGLPEGYASRLRSIQFGTTLTLHLLNRVDLIPLKLYAASDRFSSRQAIHFADLRLLKPTFEELDAALDWVRKLKDSDEKRPEIQNVLERLGFHDLANYV